jgi:hypothetical protein
MTYRAARLLLFLPLLLLQASPVHAELYLSGYLGASITEDHDVRLQDDRGAGPGGLRLRIKDVDFEASLLGGGKVGYWLGVFPYVGIEADAYHYTPEIVQQTLPATGTRGGVPVPPGSTVGLGQAPTGLDRATIGVTGLGFHLLGRLRLFQSTTFPNGRFQPYAGAGPGIFFSRFRFKPFSNQATTTTDVGVQALWGGKFFVHRNVAVFAEYKFSHFRPDVRYDSFLIGVRSTTLSTALSTHHLAGGIAVHFDLF